MSAQAVKSADKAKEWALWLPSLKQDLDISFGCVLFEFDSVLCKYDSQF